MSKELSEMCPLGEKMAKIWLKLQENGEKKSQMAKVMAKEKYILARTLIMINKYIITCMCHSQFSIIVPNCMIVVLTIQKSYAKMWSKLSQG